MLVMCPICGRLVEQFGTGPKRRPNSRCGGCESLERHRFLALLMRALGPNVTAAGTVLDVAPSPCTIMLFEGPLRPQRYVRMDFDPAADGRAVDIQASLTDIPLRSRTVDVAICYHLFEHIPDDAAAMGDLRRVLAPEGVAFVQVPWAPGRATDEDPTASRDERIRRFGQADHVRAYGVDFDARLHAAGLTTRRLTPADLIGPRGVDLYSLVPDEALWLAWPHGSETARQFDPARIRKLLRRTLKRDLRSALAADRRRPRPPVAARLRWAVRHPWQATRRQWARRFAAL